MQARAEIEQRALERALLTRLRDLSEDAVQVLAGLWDDDAEARWRLSLKDWSVSVSVLAAWRHEAVGHTAPGEIDRRRQLVSELPCGVPGCTTTVTVHHPLPAGHAAVLPDTSWVRCAEHIGSRRLAVVA